MMMINRSSLHLIFCFTILHICGATGRGRFFWKWFILFNELSTIPWFTLFWFWDRFPVIRVNLCCPHTETSQLICTENQLTGFYMRTTLALKSLKSFYAYFSYSCDCNIEIVWRSHMEGSQHPPLQHLLP